MKQMSIKNMTLEILKDATKGRRDSSNFAEGMYIAENMSKHYYRMRIECEYLAWKQSLYTSRQIMETIYREMVTRSTFNHQAKMMAACIKKVVLS